MSSLQTSLPRLLTTWLTPSGNAGDPSLALRARTSRLLRASLARYIPGAVVAQVTEGGDTQCGEREVSVMFVDLRDFTALAERHSAEETFQFVSRYTQLVSRVVTEHGGSVVEFNGDGMMAVFGAPRSLSHKERQAVSAARRMSNEIAAIHDPADGSSPRLGVGIATGTVFVGNIRAVDRWIWSAIGNATNLASRLQALSRDLESSIVIDCTTNARARAHVRDFRLVASVPIRGRRRPVDVFALHASAKEVGSVERGGEPSRVGLLPRSTLSDRIRSLLGSSA